MESCLVTDCGTVFRWLRFYIFYVISFLLVVFIPVAVWNAMAKASFIFYRIWSAVNERNDSFQPTFANARKLAKITWSELCYAQRRIERSRHELSMDLSAVEGIRRQINDDIRKLPPMDQRKSVFFVEPNRRYKSSSSSASSPSTAASVDTAPTSFARSTPC